MHGRLRVSNMLGKRTPIPVRLARLTDRSGNDFNGLGPCWIFTGSLMHSGYGNFIVRNSEGKRIHSVAHRASYEFFVGPIPEGLELDHLCRNRACCNPRHVEPVTRQINLLRGETIPATNSQKTHCKRGHEFTRENTRVWRKMRFCRQCGRLANIRASALKRKVRAEMPLDERVLLKGKSPSLKGMMTTCGRGHG